ncbi:uroporphyrinogen-III synthase [Salipaludibacillus aurantiacus]|uniref:Uroporphyrinogen-III synthase n=1 Tax=Salipaludibacillus aurantiacus TaxID=1601833 RepID=A0A1H9T4U5_9BACI|nr:uroporphyrinogen-III synthase [Salipaludibacillus aurantiacus]SER91759.1 uroporphyrinogen-III synthase/uroporphyrinogen III methyltransferase / synthase [Salipaludibacillus aurantiacus]
MGTLQGLRIINTRAEHQAASLTEAIRQRGGISIEIPLIAIRPPNDRSQIKKEIASIHKSDWVIFTSVNSYRFTCEFLEEAGYNPGELLSTKKIAAVGRKTKDVLQIEGVKVDVCPEVFDADHLAEALINRASPEEIFFYPRSSLSRAALMDKIKAANRSIFDITVYETVTDRKNRKKLNSLIKNGEVDVVILTSPSAVESFFGQVDEQDAAEWSFTFAVIGRVTHEALSRYDVTNVLVPEEFTLDAVLDKIENDRKAF